MTTSDEPGIDPDRTEESPSPDDDNNEDERGIAGDDEDGGP